MINMKTVTSKIYYFDCTDLMRLLSGFLRGMNAYFNSMLQFGPKSMRTSIEYTRSVFTSEWNRASVQNFSTQVMVMNLISKCDELCLKAVIMVWRCKV